MSQTRTDPIPPISILWVATIAQALTRFFGYFGVGETTDRPAAALLPASGIMQNLRVVLAANVGGAGQSVTFTVMKNGIATLLAVTILSGAQYGQNVTDQVQFSDTDTITVRIVTSATTATVVARMHLLYNPSIHIEPYDSRA